MSVSPAVPSDKDAVDMILGLAGFMQQNYLQGAQLKPAKGLFKAHVKLTVMVGADQSH